MKDLDFECDKDLALLFDIICLFIYISCRISLMTFERKIYLQKTISLPFFITHMADMGILLHA